MPEDFSQLNENEQLKAENDFLKIKLMLEHGAQFDEVGDNELPAQIENEFLSNVIAFEKQFEQRKRIKVHDKIERPLHFKRVDEIPDDEIDNAWTELSDYLNKYNIDLAVCSPNISVRELYRFATEELFEHEMDDMDLPGWTTNFTYDEFHPDPVYDNSRAATQDCIWCFLSKREIEWLYSFKKEGLRLNAHEALTEERLIELVNQFKRAYDDIELSEEEMMARCTIDGDNSSVIGKYSLKAIAGREKVFLSGNWKVDFIYDKDTGYWEIINVQIDGIHF